MQKNTKFCPRCGAQLNGIDSYCIRCGYSFRKRGKKVGLMQILIVILLVVAGWVGLRMFLKKPIIPTEFIELIKNMTTPR